MTQETLSGKAGLEKLNLSTEAGAHAEIFLQGAHVTSWQPAGSTDNRLFLSDASHYSPGVAIRGGVPVIFPQFGGFGSLRKHGFARTRDWQLLSSGQLDACTSQAVFVLSSCEETRALWPYNFAVSYTVTLSDSQLDMQLKVVNTGAETFSFTAALHTYLAVGNVRKAQLHGLRGSQWTTGEGTLQAETAQALTFDRAIDRIYHKTSSPLTLESPSQRTELHAQGFEDTVVWNPWADASAAMDDMTDDGYEQMLCAEAAAALNPVSLASNESWSGRQTLVALDLPTR